MSAFPGVNFLPASLSGLNVTDTVDFTGPGGAFSSVSGVNIMGGGAVPQPGQQISLIHATNGFAGGNAIVNNGQTLTGKKGALLDILFRLDQQFNDLYAVVEG
ncbi:MAG: hypothetical protein LBI88_04505, partial [Deltaproteobacteria bacterium]|nr:hypothetical protein [Deltaproteobacteria bacterium]